MILNLKILGTIIAMLLIAHYVACFWHSVGSFRFEGEGWLLRNHLKGLPVGRLYLISLEWALAQSGLASSAITPTNDPEKAFGVSIGLLWFIVKSMFVSMLTLWMSHMTLAHEEEYVEAS